MEENDHLSLKRALEAAKRDLEAEYRRKAEVLDAALAIVEEIGPDLQPADVARLMPNRSEVPVRTETPPAAVDSETDIEEPEADIEQLPDTEQEPDAVQENMWEDETPNVNGETKHFKLINEIREAIRGMRGTTFAQKDITEILSKKHPDRTIHSGSVSTALGKMAQRGEIRLVKRPHGGSDPALYREGSMSR